MANSVYLRDSSSIKFDFMNCQFANLVLAQLYRISDTKTQTEDPDLLDTLAMVFIRGICAYAIGTEILWFGQNEYGMLWT